MEEIINETCYIMHNPSMWGMGSNTDCYLITETDLKRVIAMELEKQTEGRNYNDRYTGTWMTESCIEGTKEEKIASIIDMRLHTSSTYARYNDLVKIPDDVKISKRDQVMEKKIFRIFNQFACARDVIARKAHFFQYYVDLMKHGKVADLEGGKIHEFTRFEMEGVLLNDLCEWNRVDEILEANYIKLKRLTAKRQRKEVPNLGCLDDYLEGMEKFDEYLGEEIKKVRWVIAHLEERVEMQDQYYEYMYQQEWSTGGWWKEVYCDSVKEDKKRDHTQYVYSAFWDFSLLGCIISGYEEGHREHRYDELFQSKCNVEYLLCSRTNIDSSIWKTVDELNTLRDVFGYD